MKRFILFILAFCAASFSAMADTTFVDTAAVLDGVWTIEGSPYVVSFGVSDGPLVPEGGTLTIEPGVRVLFREATGLGVGGSIIACGTLKDSIYFLPIEGYWCGLGSALGEEGRSLEFEYCRFEHTEPMQLGDEPGGAGISMIGEGNLTVRHSTFYLCNIGLYVGETNILVEDCAFYAMPRDTAHGFNTDGILDEHDVFGSINRCIFYGYFDVAPLNIGDMQSGDITVSHCLFIQNDPLSMRINGNVHLDQNITCLTGAYANLRNENTLERNCFFGNPERRFNWRPEPDTLVGFVDRLNPNGDSCDAYGNIFLDPGIREGWQWPDPDFLNFDSPCIDAGDPDSPLDPDSTVADIGPFFYSQPNIGVDREQFLFEATPVGSSDALVLIVRNRGDQRGLRLVVDAQSLSPAFSLIGGGDTAVVPAQEQVELILEFQPDEAIEYLDTLTIFSNDRDEGVIRLPIRGVGANEVGGDRLETSPTEFGIVSVSPNPFNSTITISYQTDPINRGSTTLGIYGLDGRKIVDLLDSNSKFQIPNSKFTWDASAMPAGVYIVRLQSASQMSAKKVVLMK